MIAHIKGNIIYKDQSFVIIDTGNIGYEVKISLNTFSKIKDKDKCSLFTFLQIKEDGHNLYGFITMAEKNCFLSLIGVKSVGPSVAMTMLSVLNVEEIISAIIKEDLSLIKSIKGIGNKVAQRIILELKDKMGNFAINTNLDNTNSINSNLREEAIAALMTLGINKSAAEKSINDILRDSKEDISLEKLIKSALNN